MKVLTILISFFFFLNTNAQKRTDPFNQDKELGKVSWYRNYDAALRLAAVEEKPVLILFQEVPGCATCKNYGQNVLSHPLMTEVIENEFIPLVIFNNKGGEDAKILKRYKEPSWNNPVVRIVDAFGENIVKRVASDYSAKGLYNAMVEALERTNQKVPGYMELLGEELSARNNPHLKETHFKMFCFWTGEKELGNQSGILATQAGFMDRSEVVKVVYDASRISEKQLRKFAKSKDMQPIPLDESYVWASSDEDYFINHSPFKYLPLSIVQRTKINSALGFRKPAEQFLSPKQRLWLAEAKKNKGTIYFNGDFESSWERKHQSE